MEVIGDYEILRELGRGAFATVYLARERSLDREVALKVSANRGREALNMAHLEHDHIVRVFSEKADPDRNLRWIAMQFVPGVSLETMLSNDAVLPLETVVGMGARLASALAYAHARGVLHLDVKPANILVNPEGRPFLTDFNTSLGRGEKPKELTAEELRLVKQFGLTQAVRETNPGVDVEALVGILKTMVSRLCEKPERHESYPALQAIWKTTISTASDLERRLNGFLELHASLKSLPKGSVVTRATVSYPFWAFLFFTVTPQLIGSVVNISYNQLHIVSQLSPAQQTTFAKLCLVYNAVMYPVCVYGIASHLGPFLKFLRGWKSGVTPSLDEQKTLRRKALALPFWTVLFVTLGWMPGSLIFPAILGGLYGHFFVSFALAWIVALSYSFLYVKYVAYRVIYPKLWSGEQNIRENMAEELSRHGRFHPLLNYAAGFVPLLGGVVLLALDADRRRVLALIVCGIIGLVFSLHASQRLAKTQEALTAGR